MRIIVHNADDMDAYVFDAAGRAARKLVDQEPGTTWGIRMGPYYFSVKRNQTSVSVWPAPMPEIPS